MHRNMIALQASTAWYAGQCVCDQAQIKHLASKGCLLIMSLRSSSCGPALLEAVTPRLASKLAGLSVTWHRVLLLRQDDFDHLRLLIRLNHWAASAPEPIKMRLLYHHMFKLLLTAAGGLALMFGKAMLVWKLVHQNAAGCAGRPYDGSIM